MRIGHKIYFDKETGNVLQITPELDTDYNIIEPTKEEDYTKYPILQSIDINNIEVIKLGYGKLIYAKSYAINLETKELDIEYYTQDELRAIQMPNQETQDLKTRISDISIYLSNSNETTIADMENSILEIEKNKILGVV